MKLKTFIMGGVHPEENKLSKDASIELPPMPKTVTIPAAQHIGAPATIIVKKGDVVKVGTLIAEASGFISANIHSSVSGTVSKIAEVSGNGGYKIPAVEIAVEGDEWEEAIDRSETLITEITATPEEIVTKVKDAGIVGLGGACFPTNVKLMVPPGKTAEYLVINAVECEPYLTADHRAMLEQGEELIQGIKIAMKAIGVTKAIIGVENNKKDAIAHLAKITANENGIEVVALKVQYPQGGEKQLINAVLGREVPSGALPIEVGCVVSNVGTLIAVYEAVQKNKPLIERIVTITGKSVSKPCNLKVRIGTNIGEIIEVAGGIPTDTGKIVNGGPMMGQAIFNPAGTPVTKGTSGVLIFNNKETKRNKETNCIRCAKCVSVCPMGLEPFLINSMAKKLQFEGLNEEKILDCIECGSCSYICPANLPLLDYIRVGKNETNKLMRARN
jgi:Na+-translocating ferredoxin:NAD+ oxidoreductase subunit C